ncbi:hypothetical protein A2U01_0116190, partial [Trifolium medium]|nr:hypothetical protein [Trifolium medium]
MLVMSFPENVRTRIAVEGSIREEVCRIDCFAMEN